jgi:hypothetical protein
MDQAAHGHEPVIREEEAIQHPLGIYFKIWILLFVLSAMSYAVDYYQVQGYMRWFPDFVFHGAEGWSDYCGLHAYGMGTVGYGVFYPRSAGAFAYVGGDRITRG